MSQESSNPPENLRIIIGVGISTPCAHTLPQVAYVYPIPFPKKDKVQLIKKMNIFDTFIRN